MLSYLGAERDFLRAFGNRGLILIFLCLLTRTKEDFGKLSAAGISIDLNPGVIAIFGPFVALIILCSLKIESDSLLVARSLVLDEQDKISKPLRAPSNWTYIVFAVPSLAAIFMFIQFETNVELVKKGCGNRSLFANFFDFTANADAAIYCMHDSLTGVWIYPPYQSYVYLLTIAGCAYLTYSISKRWSRYRGVA